ncbi:hypothetical protein Tco_1413542, partial [Tanacetum coccineum]
LSNYFQVEEMTRRLDMCGDVQSKPMMKFSNKEGKIETGSTCNCVENVAVVAVVYAFAISLSYSYTGNAQDEVPGY